MYLNSKRYAEARDQSGNINNVYDPSKIQQAKRRKRRIPAVYNPIETVIVSDNEDITIWNAKLNQNVSPVAPPDQS